MSFVPGEIVLAAFPFTNLSGRKRRPCVVLATGDDHNEFIVAFITSNVARLRLASALGIDPSHSEWRATGLKAPSVVRVDKLVTLHASVISGALGRLPEDLLNHLRSKLKTLFHIP